MFQSSLLRLPHGFFTRRGGGSEGLFESLNFSSRDDFETVEQNKAVVCARLGFEKLVLLKQVHSGKVIVVDEPQNPVEGDALVTQTPGLLLGIQTADCVPILLHDPITQTIAAVHCGWRGTVKEHILKNTIQAMKDIGVNPLNIRAGIGPCIRKYEVGHDVVAHLPSHSSFVKQGKDKDHFWLNLPGVVNAKLKEEGVCHIDDLGLDTMFNEALFFSCRRAFLCQELTFGHQISVIGLKSQEGA